MNEITKMLDTQIRNRVNRAINECESAELVEKELKSHVNKFVVDWTTVENIQVVKDARDHAIKFIDDAVNMMKQTEEQEDAADSLDDYPDEARVCFKKIYDKLAGHDEKLVKGYLSKFKEL